MTVDQRHALAALARAQAKVQVAEDVRDQALLTAAKAGVRAPALIAAGVGGSRHTVYRRLEAAERRAER